MNRPPVAPRPDRAAVERERCEFLVGRDGATAAVEWVRRTAGIYRQAVLNPHHHASHTEYRRLFIASYCAFKAWLADLGAAGSPSGVEAASHE